MAKLARAGVRCVTEMRRHVEMYVKHDLFAGQTAPPMTDSQLWPNNKSIINSIYYATRLARFAFGFLAFDLAHVTLYCVLGCYDWLLSG